MYINKNFLLYQIFKVNLSKLLTTFPEFIDYIKEYQKLNKIISNKDEVDNIFK